MSVFGMPDHHSRDEATKLARAYEEAVFDLPQEMAAAMRLMANPAAGMMAMSAFGFGIASQMFGLWAGAVAGAAQASQRLLASQGAGQGAEAGAAPVRAKPALKVVAKNEPSARAPVVVPMKPTEAAAPVAPAADKTQVATERVGTVANADKVKPAAVEPKPATEAARAEAALLPEDFHKPRSLERPAAPDDLKAISGIGPKLEKVLNDLGVWTYAQIAAWEPREVAWVDDYLSFKGRIDRDGWIGQAANLAANGNRKGK